MKKLILTILLAASLSGFAQKGNKAPDPELMDFIGKHMPDVKTEIDELTEAGDKKTVRMKLRDAKFAYMDYLDILEYDGDEAAALYLQQVTIQSKLDKVADDYEAAKEAEDDAKAKALYSKLGSLLKDAQGLEIKSLRTTVAMVEEELTFMKEELAAAENEPVDVDELIEAFLANGEEPIDSAEGASTKLPEGWHLELDAAKAAAKEHNKPIMAVFSTSWCAPCQAMVKGVYPKDEVKAALDAYTPLYVDGDKYPAVCKSYKVRGFPTFLILDAEGEMKHKANFGGTNADTFVNWLEASK